MFFNFPLQATADNWVSESLTSQLLELLRALKRGEEAPEFLESTREEYRIVLLSYPVIQQNWEALVEALTDLTANELDVVKKAVTNQNELPGVLTDLEACIQCREQLPEVHDRALELFRACFERLGSIQSPNKHVSIRDNHYHEIFSSIPRKCCPFCGMDLFDMSAPGIGRPQLDHYLPITIYPFAGVNLKNLVPMGDACNTRYKRAVDLLYDGTGKRTRCFDPYGNLGASVEMERSRVLTTPGTGPDWVLELQPNTEEAAQWDRVFRVRKRLKAKLSAQYKEWLVEIGGYLHHKGRDAEDRDELLQTLKDFGQICRLEALHAIAVIKEAFVNLLIRDLEDEAEGDRMQQFLSTVFS